MMNRSSAAAAAGLRPLLLVAAAGCLGAGAVSSSSRAAAEPTPPPAATASALLPAVATLPVEQFNVVVEKANAYTAALNVAQEVHRSYDAYAAAVNVKRGPTGKEANLRGPGPIPAEDTARVQTAATDLAPRPPALPAADAAIADLAASLTALAPLAQRAAGYYGAKEFKADDLRLGRELHGQMIPWFERFFAAETALRAAVAEVRPLVERRQMAVGEQARGRDLGWHVRSTLAAAKPLVELIPAQAPPPNRPPMDPKLYATRLTDLETAWTALDTYANAHPPEIAALPEGPALRGDLAALLAAARGVRPALEAKRLDPAAIGKRINDLITRYNAAVKRVNAAALANG